MQEQNSVTLNQDGSLNFSDQPRIEVTVQVKRLNESARLPEYGHADDSCFDIFAAEHHLVSAFDYAVVGTGISLQAPAGFAFQIFDRSGLAANHGISTRGGVIDHGFTGEIKVILQNESEVDFLVEPGDKIAQVKLERIWTAVFEEVTYFTHKGASGVEYLETGVAVQNARGNNGFGSTGMKSTREQ